MNVLRKPARSQQRNVALVALEHYSAMRAGFPKDGIDDPLHLTVSALVDIAVGPGIAREEVPNNEGGFRYRLRNSALTIAIIVAVGAGFAAYDPTQTIGEADPRFGTHETSWDAEAEALTEYTRTSGESTEQS